MSSTSSPQFFANWLRQWWGAPKLNLEQTIANRDAALLHDERARLVELEGIDKACDAANQHVLSLQADLDKVCAELSRERAQSAAVPELLEALKAFVAAEDEWVNEKGGMADGTFDDPLGDACIQAKVAIANTEKLLALTPSDADAARERERKLVDVLVEALEAALPRLAHNLSDCLVMREARDWGTLGQFDDSTCHCEIATVKAAIAKAREGKCS